MCYGYDAVNPSGIHNVGNIANNRAPYFRHDNRASVVFADGHIESRNKKQVPSPEGYPDVSTNILKNTWFNMGKIDNDSETLEGF